jgi:MoaA/NifB/PqqE/SkfB family radical SAM enzyme/SAM-dependent methyltransferase
VSFDITAWTRLESDGIPVYLQPARPDWFVPNAAADRILQTLAAGTAPDGHLETSRLLDRLPDRPIPAYAGRSGHLSLDHLRELWLHVTNRCNMACRHCLFASGPDDAAELPADRVLDLAREASRLGCRVFALTGGEPTIHPDFDRIVDGLLALEDAAVAVLTNGRTLPALAGALKRWPPDRFHLQVSLDGLGDRHDRIRGRGAMAELERNLACLRDTGRPFTLSMCVTGENVADMPGLVRFAAGAGATNVHFMWYFVRGRGERDEFVPPHAVFPHLVKAAEAAEATGVGIDNLDALASQAFAPPGTIHDGSTSGWESVAVGPDGRLYPSAALIGMPDLAAPLDDGLERAWREGPALRRLRESTAAGLDSPLRLLTGGGDPDHSYTAGGTFVGDDPYLLLQERTLLWLIAREASRWPDDGPPAVRLKMGDVLESCGPHGPVATVHNNCLVSVARTDGRTAVRTFYAEAARNPREDILNPVAYPEDLIAHIPNASRVRSYGCGSPVLEATLAPGERVVDLGSGSGVECFIASRLVGPDGEVVGVDMLDAMLGLARKGARGVAERLGYANLAFRKGYLEDVPLEDDWADVVVSNCVLNLLTHKRRTFAEIRRILKPGGRLVVADVVCETEPDPAIRNDDSLRGECIAGALAQRDLAGLLRESGLVGLRVLTRFPYRTVRGHPFYSLTFEARKAAVSGETARVMYRGPFASVTTHAGTVLPAGRTREVPADEVRGAGDDLLRLDAAGRVTNVVMEASLSCAVPPEAQGTAPSAERPGPAKHPAGCMVCGAPLVYHDGPRSARCAYCGEQAETEAVCEAGHFVCDACHAADALALIERSCLASDETDMVTLMGRIRRHPAVPMHGPEHHALVPGVILATARNLGEPVTDELIRRGIRRGSQVCGGHCAYLGACGAALGVGVAFGILLDASPVKATERQAVQSAVNEALAPIADLEAARCCQRDAWLAFRKAADTSQAILGFRLHAEAVLVCTQMAENAECIGPACPLVRARTVIVAEEARDDAAD